MSCGDIRSYLFYKFPQ